MIQKCWRRFKLEQRKAQLQLDQIKETILNENNVTKTRETKNINEIQNSNKNFRNEIIIGNSNISIMKEKENMLNEEKFKNSIHNIEVKDSTKYNLENKIAGEKFKENLNNDSENPQNIFQVMKLKISKKAAKNTVRFF